MDIIFKALTERPFSHRGSYYQIPPEVPYRGYDLKELTVVPRPLYRPLECWQPIQSASTRGLDFMVKHGIKGLIGGGVAEGGAMQKVLEAWQSAHHRAGQNKALGEDLSIGFHFFLADSVEEGIRRYSGYYEENIKMFGPLRLVRALTDPQILDMGDPNLAPSVGLPTMEEAIEAGAVLCGPPERIIQQLKALEERCPGLDRVSVSQPVGTPQNVILEQLEWFSQEVIPQFVGRSPAFTKVA